jgi:BED zinc finger
MYVVIEIKLVNSCTLKMSKRSLVHTYFKQIDAQKVQCLKCNLALAVKCGSTGTLRNHLQYKHPEYFEELITSEKDAKISKCNLVSKMKLYNRVGWRLLVRDTFCYVAILHFLYHFVGSLFNCKLRISGVNITFVYCLRLC